MSGKKGHICLSVCVFIHTQCVEIRIYRYEMIMANETQKLFPETCKTADIDNIRNIEHISNSVACILHVENHSHNALQAQQNSKSRRSKNYYKDATVECREIEKETGERKCKSFMCELV